MQMNNSGKSKFILKWVIVYLLLFTSLFAQSTLESQFKYAHDLFNNELYFESITEFKRLIFFDKEKKFNYETNFKIGEAYKAGAYFENAIVHFSDAKYNADDTELIFDAEIQIIRCNILRKTTDRALQLLEKLESNPDYTRFKNEIEYWKGWAYMFAGNWDAAAEVFPPGSELNLLADQVDEDKYSVTFATVISYILPGAGQIYTGNYFSGFMSLAWNALWGYLTVNAFMEDRAFDGIAVGSLLWLRFYRGNVQNAGKLAEIENIKIANEALSYLQNKYRGTKP